MSLNRELLTRIARKLGSLRDRLVFVGGSVVELYFTDPASDRVRPTTDTDAICEVTSYTAFHRLGDALRERGFRQRPEASDPPYRWRHGGDVLDLMPRDAAVLGFSNRWYDLAVERTRDAAVAPGLAIRIPAPEVYLATKLSAHEGRGLDDPFTSADLEDVVALFTNRPELVREVLEADAELRDWIRERTSRFFPESRRTELVAAFLPETRSLPGLTHRVVKRLDSVGE